MIQLCILRELFLDRKISKKEAEELAAQFKCPYVECSARDSKLVGKEH